MYSSEVTVKNKEGLHARPAILVVKKAAEYDSRVVLEKDGKQADVCSLTAVLQLDVDQGERVTIWAEGEEEVEVVEELVYLIEKVLPARD